MILLRNNKQKEYQMMAWYQPFIIMESQSFKSATERRRWGHLIWSKRILIGIIHIVLTWLSKSASITYLKAWATEQSVYINNFKTIRIQKEYWRVSKNIWIDIKNANWYMLLLRKIWQTFPSNKIIKVKQTIWRRSWYRHIYPIGSLLIKNR